MWRERKNILVMGYEQSARDALKTLISHYVAQIHVANNISVHN